jgi:hypothetical protein
MEALMSQETTNQPRLSAEDAYNVLTSQIHGPVFFTKLAEYGVVPQTEQQVRQLLVLAGQLRIAEQNQATKQASHQGDWLDQAISDLDRVMGGSGATAAPQIDQTAVKQAAAQACQQPLIREAALTYNAALQNLLAQQAA